MNQTYSTSHLHLLQIVLLIALIESCVSFCRNWTIHSRTGPGTSETPPKLCKPRVRTNTGKQMSSFKAIDLWKYVPQNLKDLDVYTFSKNIKNFLLSQQYSKNPLLELKGTSTPTKESL